MVKFNKYFVKENKY